MKKVFMILPLVLVLCFFCGCEKEADKAAVEVGVKALTTEDVAAIKALGPAIDKAALIGNWDAFFELFAEDMVMMPPNMPAVKGRPAYVAWFKSMDVKFTESNYKVDKIDGYGDIAYATATYTETFSIAGVEEPIYDEGKILTILRKQPDGSWLFSIWMWASDLPLAE